MVQAIKTIRPALSSFYTSLSDEQKAQFNGSGSLGHEALMIALAFDDASASPLRRAIGGSHAD